MNIDKRIKRIKIIGIVLMAVGGLMILSNLPAYLVLNLTKIERHADVTYVSPLFFVLNGILLFISGLLLKALRKTGLIFSIISSITTIALICIHSYFYTSGMTGELKNIGIIGSIIFVLIFLIPSIFMIRFLTKKESLNNYR